MVTDGHYTYTYIYTYTLIHGEHNIMYKIVKLSCYTPETNIILHVNCTSIIFLKIGIEFS